MPLLLQFALTGPLSLLSSVVVVVSVFAAAYAAAS